MSPAILSSLTTSAETPPCFQSSQKSYQSRTKTKSIRRLSSDSGFCRSGAWQQV